MRAQQLFAHGRPQLEALWRRLTPAWQMTWAHMAARTAGRSSATLTVIAPPADAASPFAQLISTLLQHNLQADPGRAQCAPQRPVRVALLATDLNKAATLAFAPGKLAVHAGIVGIPDLTIKADSEDILAMSRLPLTTPWRLPDVRQAAWHELLQRQRQGRVQMHGLWRHPQVALALLQLMSVH
ncbi:MAG: hypothetical protein ACPGUV_03015 [Polyangiales bacterium]